MSDVFENLHQVEQYLKESGYQCSYKKIKAAVDKRKELKERRGGGWTARTVDQYARAFLVRKIDPSAEQDAPAVPEAPDTGAAARKMEKQADFAEVQALKVKIALNEQIGRLIHTSVIEAELGERAKAFRLGLERFGLEQAEAVAGLFGGGRRQAHELARRLGFAEGEETERAIAVIIDFCLDRSGAFPRFFTGKVDSFLDPYATGTWWTEDMAAAWDIYQRHMHEVIPEVESHA